MFAAQNQGKNMNIMPIRKELNPTWQPPQLSGCNDISDNVVLWLFFGILFYAFITIWRQEAKARPLDWPDY
jgi:hypothetical protein